MRKLTYLLTAAAVSSISATISKAAWAASLQVSPVTVEVPAPGVAAVLKLRNEGTTSINAQLRVFRWSQSNGEEKLEPTEDVVASPPMASLAAKTDYTVRLVRVTKQPIAAEETYRLLIDELPDPRAQRSRTITMVLRYSIPVFFLSPDASAAKLAWAIEQRNGRATVAVTNTGARHARISALQLHGSGGTVVSFGSGLTGYALGGSTMRWSVPPNAPRLDGAGPVVITGNADTGPINASASVRAAR
jgi:fimbrial chaperone protein